MILQSVEEVLHFTVLYFTAYLVSSMVATELAPCSSVPCRLPISRESPLLNTHVIVVRQLTAVERLHFSPLMTFQICCSPCDNFSPAVFAHETAVSQIPWPSWSTPPNNPVLVPWLWLEDDAKGWYGSMGWSLNEV